VTSLLFLLLNWMIAGSFDNTVIRPEAFLLLLPFAAGVALAAVLYAVKSLTHAWRLVLHFAVCTLSAYLFLYLPAGTAASGGMKLLMLMLIILLYWIATACGLVALTFMGMPSSHRFSIEQFRQEKKRREKPESKSDKASDVNSKKQ
jgi:hypothetical protein